MNVDSDNNFSSRQRFKTGKFLNWVKLAGLFIGCVIVLSWIISVAMPGNLLPMFIADALLLLGAYYLHILWDKVPLRLVCPKCEKIILSNTPWTCSVCNKQNLNTTEFPFVHRCGNPECGVEPKAYRCHHKDEKGVFCNGVIYLTEDRDSLNCAYHVNQPTESTPSQIRDQTLQDLQKSKAEKEVERDIALIDDDLALLRQRKRGRKQKRQSPGELLKSEVDQVMELEEEGEMLKAKYAKEHPGDRTRIVRYNAAVDARVIKIKTRVVT